MFTHCSEDGEKLIDLGARAQRDVETARAAVARAQASCVALSTAIGSTEVKSSQLLDRERLVQKFRRIAAALGSVAMIVASLDVDG